jgi:hypothetical protein
MEKKINGKMVKITNAGYLYIDGVKVADKKITPLYHATELVDDPQIADAIRDYTARNWRMVNN